MHHRLRSKISQSATLASESNDSCNLKRAGCVCKKRGFHLHAKGAYLTAELCECVKTCLTCFGSCRQEVQGAITYCSDPNPVRIVNAYQEAKIPALYLQASLEAFKNFSGNGREQLQRIKAWAQKFNPVGGPGLVISGPVGVGKTYVLCALAKFFIEKRSVGQVRFVDFHRLLSVIRQAYSDRKSEEEILAPLINADVLIIDELGKGRNNDWEQEKLDQIVMGRYGQNKVIIASTNYSLKENKSSQSLYNVELDQMAIPSRGQFDPDVFESLESRVGKRIFSRIYETSMLVDLGGEDFRKSNRRIAREFQHNL